MVRDPPVSLNVGDVVTGEQMRLLFAELQTLLDQWGCVKRAPSATNS
jgi:hypothetical protein